MTIIEDFKPTIIPLPLRYEFEKSEEIRDVGDLTEFIKSIFKIHPEYNNANVTQKKGCWIFSKDSFIVEFSFIYIKRRAYFKGERK